MKKQGLLMKFVLVFLVFTLVTLATSGIAAYVYQRGNDQAEQERKLQNIASYLSAQLQADGRDFPMYQAYFVEYHNEMQVPVDFTDADIQAAREAFETRFAAEQPGKVLGQDVTLPELSPELQDAYAVYNHEYYLTLFEKAAATFGLTYAYYIVPTGEKEHMYWVLDAVREERDESGCINLGLDVLEPLEKHRRMWEAWNTGMAPSGYDVYDDSYELGKTYAWYTPLYIDGVKLGLIGTEVGIAAYNHAIMMHTLRLLGVIAMVLFCAVAATLWLIDHLYISKIRQLARAVSAYAKDKNADIAEELQQSGKDELCTLSNQTAAMILELDNYMKSLVATTEELSQTREQVDIQSALARKDALTGVHNRNAYEEEVQRLAWQMLEGETRFGFAVVDVNFLKRINDTSGHEAGNRTIQECCAAVCSVFAHSPVFRIGGDEFAVVLRNEDYEHIEELVERFESLQGRRDNEPWFSAAIGYALYDSAKDDCVENVFSRADKAMYRCKRRMKALR